MDGIIRFQKPESGLVDSKGAAITDGAVLQVQVIPKRTILRLRVVEERDSSNSSMLKTLALRLEVAGLGDVSMESRGDIILLARLDDPNNGSIPAFFAHVTAVQSKVSSNNDEDLTYRTTFP